MRGFLLFITGKADWRTSEWLSPNPKVVAKTGECGIALIQGKGRDIASPYFDTWPKIIMPCDKIPQTNHFQSRTSCPFGICHASIVILSLHVRPIFTFYFTLPVNYIFLVTILLFHLSLFLLLPSSFVNF